MGLLEVKETCSAICSRWVCTGRGDQGGYTFRVGSSRLFLDVDEYGKDDEKFTALIINAPIVRDLKPTPELYKYVALNADTKLFGHLGLHEDAEDGTVVLVFSHTLLADYLDPEELQHAVGAVAGTADHIDDELAAKFGGSVFHPE